MTTATFELARGLEVTTEAGPPSVVADGWIVQGKAVTLSSLPTATRFFRHGWHSWGLVHWADLSRPPIRLAPESNYYGADNIGILGDEHRGNWVGAVELQDGTHVVIGALGFDAHVTGTSGGMVGQAVTPIDWFVGHGTDAELILERYAELLGERLGNVMEPPGHVWCSWYSFYEDITEENMLEALSGVEGLGFDVFQLDDGWQVEVGDWQVNDDFPNGMASMANRITDAGYRPGIWIAPFIAHERSETFREHPEWFVAIDGQPAVAGHNWNGLYYGLDTTHPQAREHIANVISTAVGWGYTYLKLDFLFAAGIPGDRHDDSISMDAAYRSGVELIRDAAGPDVYLLACGSLIVPSIGVFNGMRVGQDVAPHWENRLGIDHYSDVSTRFAISNSLARLWLAPVVAVDPDVVYFRSAANEMDAEQMQYLQDIASICDFVATSDPPRWMTDDERAALKMYLSSRPNIVRVDRYQFDIDGRRVSFRDVSLDE